MNNKNHIVYKNLYIEIAKKEISINQLANGMGVACSTLQNKLSGKESFNLDEASYMVETFFPENDIFYLFEELLTK